MLSARETKLKFHLQIFEQTSLLFTHNPTLHIRNKQFAKSINSQLQSQKAMGNLGTLCAQGQGVPQSYERAAELFKQSAAQGEPVRQRDQAQFHLQILQIFSFKSCFMNGRKHLYCKPSHLAKPTDGCTLFQSQNGLKNLGVCHENGLGATKSYADARRLYERSLARGYAQAAEHLKRLDEKIRTECPLLGKRVSITGTSREDLNGRTGVATSFDHTGGRYVVELLGQRRKRQKRAGQTEAEAGAPGQIYRIGSEETGVIDRKLYS